jgi:hypothetical protein
MAKLPPAPCYMKLLMSCAHNILPPTSMRERMAFWILFCEPPLRTRAWRVNGLTSAPPPSAMALSTAALHITRLQGGIRRPHSGSGFVPPRLNLRAESAQAFIWTGRVGHLGPFVLEPVGFANSCSIRAHALMIKISSRRVAIGRFVPCGRTNACNPATRIRAIKPKTTLSSISPGSNELKSTLGSGKSG